METNMMNGLQIENFITQLIRVSICECNVCKCGFSIYELISVHLAKSVQSEGSL